MRLRPILLVNMVNQDQSILRNKDSMYSKGISLVCSIVTTLGSEYIHSTITVLFRDFLSMLSLGATKNMCPIFPECLFYCFCRVERCRSFVLSRYEEEDRRAIEKNVL